MELADQAKSKNWKFIFVNSLAINTDSLESSLQSKYIKYLQFLNYFTEFKNIDLLYIDHSVKLLSDHVEIILKNCDSDVLIRNTPRYKANIQNEIDEALNQERYARNMPETIAWIEEKRSQGFSLTQRIMNTGLIYYRNPTKIKQLTDSVYDSCMQLSQPECQIIWGILSQDFQDRIRRIDWNLLGIAHKQLD